MSLIDEKKAKRGSRILESARFLFEQSGFDNVTMSMIASRAGLGVGTLYNYFPSKSAILMSILEESIAVVIEKVTNARYDSSDLLDMTNEYFRFFLDNIRGFGKALLRDSSHLMMYDRGLMRRGMRLNGMIVKSNEAFLRILAARGLIREDADMSGAALLLFSIMKITAMSIVFSDEEYGDEDADVVSMVRTLYYGIAR